MQHSRGVKTQGKSLQTADLAVITFYEISDFAEDSQDWENTDFSEMSPIFWNSRWSRGPPAPRSGKRQQINAFSAGFGTPEEIRAI